MLSNWLLNFATFTHMPWCFNVSTEDILSLIQIAFKSCLMAGIPQNPTADEVIEMGGETSSLESRIACEYILPDILHWPGLMKIFIDVMLMLQIASKPTLYFVKWNTLDGFRFGLIGVI